MDEMNSMRAFVKVVEAGSFAAAARSMSLSPSVITKRIKQLEDHLDVELLRRSTRALTVTDMGSAYYEHCARIVAEVDEARSSLKSMDVGLSGLFRISCTASFASKFINDDVCDFQRTHPDLRIDFRSNDYIYNPIAEGYDICIQPRDILSDTITKRPIVYLHRLLVASPKYVEDFGLPKRPDEISDHRVAFNDFVTPEHVIEFTKNGKQHFASIKPRILTNTIGMLESAILKGECIALVPIFYFADRLADGSMVPVLEEYLLPRAELSAYFRRSQHVPRMIRAFLNFLLEKYGSTPPWQEPILKSMPNLSRHFVNR